MSITLQPGQTFDLGAIYLEPVAVESALIYGTVIDGDTGGALNGVSVTVGGIYTGYTNSSGYFQITNIPAGTYNVVFSKTGYEPVTI